MPGRPGCLACPYRHDPRYTCYAAVQGFVTLCTGLAGERGQEKVDGFRRFIVEQTSGIVLPEDDGQPARELPDVRPKVSPELAWTLLRMRQGDLCSQRGDKIGQGCHCEYECKSGHGWFEPGIVTVQGCIECVQGRPPKRNSPEG